MIGESIEIDTNITEEDLIQFNMFHHNNTPNIKLLTKLTQFGLLIFAIIITIIMLIMAYLDNRMDFFSETKTILIFFLMYIISIFVILIMQPYLKWYYSKRVKKMLKESKTRLIPSKIIVAEEFIIDKDEDREQKFSWKSIERIEIAENYIYVYVYQIMALIIPNNSFENNEEKDMFIQTINKYYVKANE